MISKQHSVKRTHTTIMNDDFWMGTDEELPQSLLKETEENAETVNEDSRPSPDKQTLEFLDRIINQ
jgi:hypothetical protein